VTADKEDNDGNDDEEPEDLAIPDVVTLGESSVQPTSAATTTNTVTGGDPKELHQWVPKKIVSTYVDPQGMWHVTLLFAFTGGVLAEDNNGVSVKVTDNGYELCVSEKFPKYRLETEAFYQYFPKDPRDSEDQFNAKKLAMMDTTHKLKSMAVNGSPSSQFTGKNYPSMLTL
jgi:hypothetical protein